MPRRELLRILRKQSKTAAAYCAAAFLFDIVRKNSWRSDDDKNPIRLPRQASRCWRIMRNITAELAQIATNEINDLYR